MVNEAGESKDKEKCNEKEIYQISPSKLSKFEME